MIGTIKGPRRTYPQEACSGLIDARSECVADAGVDREVKITVAEDALLEVLLGGRRGHTFNRTPHAHDGADEELPELNEEGQHDGDIDRSTNKTVGFS